MGCGGSKTVVISQERQQPEGRAAKQSPPSEGRHQVKHNQPAIAVTHQEQISLVENTWGLVSNDLEKMGVDFYARLFKEAPDHLRLFPYMDDQSDHVMRIDDRVKRKGLVTMQHVDKVVSSLNDPGFREQFQKASTFCSRKSKSVGTALLYTLDKHLGTRFTPKVKDAWTVVYGILAEKCQDQLTEEHITLVQDSWHRLKGDLERLGVDFYIRLFKEDPDLLQLFPYMEDKSVHYVMKIDDRVKRKGLVTMQHIDEAVSSLNDPDSRVYYQKLSNFCPRKSKSVETALLFTLENHLGKKFTSKVKEAWIAVYGNLTEDRKGSVTKEQIALVQDSWHLVKNDLENMGVEFYVRLFKEDPDLLRLFPYMFDQSSEYVMKMDDRVKRKGLVTIQHVNKAVTSLHDPISPVHYQKTSGFCPRKLKSVGGAFLYALDKNLGRKFTSKDKDAWCTVYGIEISPLKSEGPVIQQQISLVQETWALVTDDLEQLGVEFYVTLFKEDADLLQLFPYMDDKSTDYAMKIDDRVKRKGLVTMQHIDEAVSSLNDPNSRLHYQRLSMFCPRKLKSVGAALFYTLEKHLGKKFTSKVKEAWTAVYGIMANSEGSVTDEQISLVQDSWHLVKKDLEKLGVEFYVRLYKEDPDLLKLFPYMEDKSAYNVMKIDDRVKRKGLVTMQHIDEAVSSLKDPNSRVYFQKLSTFCPRKLKSVGAALFFTLEKQLGKKFTPKVKEAWSAVYGILAENPQGSVSDEQISLVQDTWHLVKNDLEKMAVEFYARLFNEDPDLLKLFPYMEDKSVHDVMKIDDRVKRKGLVTMQHVDKAVSSLDDPKSQVYHKKSSNFCPRKSKSVGSALIRTLEKHLGGKFTTKAKEAWTAVYKIMAEAMKEGAKKTQ